MMAKKYIKGKDGKFNGSVPDGKGVPSTIKLPSSVPANAARNTETKGIEWVVSLTLEDGTRMRGTQKAMYGHSAINFFAKNNNVEFKSASCEKKATFDVFLAKGLRTPLDGESPALTWDQWENLYKPIRNPRSSDTGIWGCMFETHGEDIKYLHDGEYNNNVYWTLVDNDPNSSYLELIPGAHMMNRLGYFVTQNPWVNENITISNKS